MFIESLHLKNILSFKDAKLDLQPLNVLIGPNGSGKSNLIDVIGLLQAVPGDLGSFLRRNGPVSNWAWQCDHSNHAPSFIAMLHNHTLPNTPLYYGLEMTIHNDGRRVWLSRETLESESDKPIYPPFLSYFDLQNSEGRVAEYGPDDLSDIREIRLDSGQLSPDKSVLSMIRDPNYFPTLMRFADAFSVIKSYRNWYVGRDSPVRHPQRTDGDPNFLEEDFSNLALVVNDLLSRRLEPSLDSYLKRFYESYESLHPRIFGNTIELIVNEAGMSTSLPASRLSDGTIRFIALLAILCHPEPPPLICIEEPEIAMHPDSLDLVVELLRKASERTQLIVTTHSPWLIDRLSAKPEQVVVCERDSIKGTQFRRFSREELDVWLEDQPLGEVWMSGAMGGVR